jgi:hypothetical protein
VLSLTAAAAAGLIVRVALFHLLALGRQHPSEARGVVAEVAAISAGSTVAVVLFSGEVGTPSIALMASVTAVGLIVLAAHRWVLARRQDQ